MLFLFQVFPGAGVPDTLQPVFGADRVIVPNDNPLVVVPR
jgi:hypothetical protein